MKVCSDVNRNNFKRVMEQIFLGGYGTNLNEMEKAFQSIGWKGPEEIKKLKKDLKFYKRFYDLNPYLARKGEVAKK